MVTVTYIYINGSQPYCPNGFEGVTECNRRFSKKINLTKSKGYEC